MCQAAVLWAGAAIGIRAEHGSRHGICGSVVTTDAWQQPARQAGLDDKVRELTSFGSNPNDP
jgi:hypothetical protein